MVFDSYYMITVVIIVSYEAPDIDLHSDGGLCSAKCHHWAGGGVNELDSVS